jgi:transposase
MTDFARTLERELAAAKAECERLRPHSLSSGEREDYHDALTELTRLRALSDQLSNNLSAVGAAYNDEKARAEKAEAECDRADAEVAALKALLLEFGQLTEGVINGGDCRENILYIHVPCEPRGHMVGQPVKVILPAINAAMKGTP